MMTTSVVLSRCVSRLGAAVTSSGSSTRAASTTANTTLDEKEVDKFSRMMKDWWDPVNGSAVGLHSMNDLRVPLIRDGLAQTRRRTDGQGPEPLAGTRILDVGCGGGILSESLARLGAQVVGIDATGDAIQAAQSHLQKDQVGDEIFLEVSK